MLGRGFSSLQGEKVEIVDQMTLQMKNSGYTRGQCVEAITSGVKGLVRKQERRRKHGERFYRRAATTLRARTLKKLTIKTTWYKMKKDEEQQQNEKDARRGGRSNKDREKIKAKQ